VGVTALAMFGAAIGMFVFDPEPVEDQLGAPTHYL
jgi:hypothetical protein